MTREIPNFFTIWLSIALMLLIKGKQAPTWEQTIKLQGAPFLHSDWELSCNSQELLAKAWLDEVFDSL